MVETPLVLGLDGGGSKTVLAQADADGRITRWRIGGGINPMDQPDWRATLVSLLSESGMPASACLGLAGYAEVPAISAELEAAAAACLPGPHSLHNDVRIAFDGAFQDRPGVLILAGTGSMAWAQSGMGQIVRVGGWGHGLGDEGSAHWVGLRALQLTTQSMDGRLADRGFAPAMLQGLGLPPDASQAALIDWHLSRRHPRSEVAALARHVARLAQRGESQAVRLMEAAADELCRHIETARRRIGDRLAPWSHAGGLFTSDVLRRAMAERIGPPVPPLLPPIGGALWRAARDAGWTADAAWTTRLADSLKGLSHSEAA